MIKTYFKYALRDKGGYIFIMLAVLVTSFVNSYYPFLSGRIVDEVTVSDYDRGYILLLSLLAIIIVRIILEQIQYYVTGIIDIKYLDRMPRTDYVAKIQSLDFAFHSSKSTGALISVSRRINSALYTFFNSINIWGVSHFLDLFLSMYFLYIIAPISAVIYFATIVITIAVSYPLIKLNMKYRKAFIDKDDEIGGVISDNMIGFETVKSFGQEQFEMNRLDRKFDEWEKAIRKYILTFRYFDMAVYFTTLLGTTGLILISYQNIRDGIWSTGAFIAILGYSTSMVWKIFNLLNNARSYMKASVDLNKFVDMMDSKSKVVESDTPKEMGELVRGIDFKNISFGYDSKKKQDEEEYVLDDISLNINLGETVAFVGRSGSGKTTLAKLLLRYYDVDKGSIEINGIDVRELSLCSLRKSIGLVPQDPIMFNESIRYNLAYGRPDASMDEIEDAAKSAALHDFIISLPKKYDTIVGERGIKLSGGQRQRLAIARVMLVNPPIIVFDEATSQLDSENEKRIQKAFKNLTEHKTTVVIAHRLSTIMHANQIIVFDKGKIVEVGTHDELVSLDGVYCKLWRLQTVNR